MGITRSPALEKQHPKQCSSVLWLAAIRVFRAALPAVEYSVFEWYNNPGWALVFSRSLFQAILLPASVLQSLVLKTWRSFSRPSIHLRLDLSVIEDFFSSERSSFILLT
ncbi:hypothetical protein TNCV_4246191 [Trichonephila clavipes]|nr:hypothetical protein TNCV_4246191 [Trichonephila clavipes]